MRVTFQGSNLSQRINVFERRSEELEDRETYGEETRSFVDTGGVLGVRLNRSIISRSYYWREHHAIAQSSVPVFRQCAATVHVFSPSSVNPLMQRTANGRVAKALS
jgi:hypothetical protein